MGQPCSVDDNLYTVTGGWGGGWLHHYPHLPFHTHWGSWGSIGKGNVRDSSVAKQAQAATYTLHTTPHHIATLAWPAAFDRERERARASRLLVESWAVERCSLCSSRWGSQPSSRHPGSIDSVPARTGPVCRSFSNQRYSSYRHSLFVCFLSSQMRMVMCDASLLWRRCYECWVSEICRCAVVRADDTLCWWSTDASLATVCVRTRVISAGLAPSPERAFLLTELKHAMTGIKSEGHVWPRWKQSKREVSLFLRKCKRFNRGTFSSYSLGFVCKCIYLLFSCCW